MIIAGFICLAIGFAVADSSFDIDTQGGSQSFNIEMTATDAWGHDVYIAQTADCTSDDFWIDNENPTPRVTYSNSGQTSVMSVNCGTIWEGEETFENSHDPPIRLVGSMTAVDDPNSEGYPNACTSTAHCNCATDPDGISCEYCVAGCEKLSGTYAITCSSPCWVIDNGALLGQVGGGLMAMVGLMAIMAILLGVGDLLLCIACCCCCQGPDKGAGPPVQGMVVGQPVGSA